MESSLSIRVLQHLQDGGVDCFFSVPCKLLAEMISHLECDPGIKYYPVTREEEGVGLCAGVHLGGEMPCMLMQDSGLGNSINALASLAQLYSMPMVLLISYRGTPGEKVGAQVPMAQITKELLALLRIPVLHCHDHAQEKEIESFVEYSRVAGSPVAILLDFNFMDDQA